ncbi:ThuA domain-containing protein [Bremerella sp. JC770]|uniref:ThuA domain-containing protein n=1 Tax=Bremerella sp. JC770 TaxID=3232137 RepID=UPI003458FDF3
MRTLSLSCSCLLLLAFSAVAMAEEAKLKALIVDGQNNHGVWPKTTQMMKSYLEDSGKFTVDVATTEKKSTEGFAPSFQDYDVVISNYNGQRWPAATDEAFVDYVKNGGGFVVVHAANNAFGNWDEYNQIIGLGGWGGRNAKSGPYVYFDGKDDLVRDTSEGNGGHHGRQHPFQVVVRDADHPITAGMPKSWMHAKDELYDQLRGPAENMTVLATAYADPATGGSGRHEPMIMTIDYGKGRVFHTPMGHADYSMECAGFIATLLRGTEWAATGKVTIAIPEDFPEPNAESNRPFEAAKN